MKVGWQRYSGQTGGEYCMSRFVLLIPCLFMVFFLFSCGESNEVSETAEKEEEVESATPELKVEATPVSEDDVLLAEWDEGKIYLSQLEKILMPERARIQEALDDETMIERTLISKRSEILKNLVNNYLLLMAARDMGVELSKSEKEGIVRSIKGKFDSEEQYETYLEAVDQTEEEIVELMGKFQLGRKAMENKVDQLRESMTKEKLKEFYEEKKDFFRSIRRAELNRVEIRTKDRSEEEAKERAEKLYQEAKEKVEAATSYEERLKIMQEYAYEYSDSEEAEYNWGYIIVYDNEDAKAMYSEAFLKAIEETEEGDLSDLVKTKFGYGFFLVRLKIEEETREFDHPVSQNMLPNMYMRMKMDEWRSELKERYGFCYHRENFEGLISESILEDKPFDPKPALSPQKSQS